MKTLCRQSEFLFNGNVPTIFVGYWARRMWRRADWTRNLPVYLVVTDRLPGARAWPIRWTAAELDHFRIGDGGYSVRAFHIAKIGGGLPGVDWILFLGLSVFGPRLYFFPLES